MNFDQFSFQFVDGNINAMNVVVPQVEHVPIESSRTHHSNADFHQPGHNTERISEDSLLKSLVDEVDSLLQQNVFADLFANVDGEQNDSFQKFVAATDQKRPDCHSLGYVDPVLGDPHNESLEAGLYQVSNTIRQPEMYYGRLTGDNYHENSKQILSSGYRVGSGVQENSVEPSEQPMISEVHKQLDNFTVVQQQLDRQKLLTEDEEALIKQIVQESAIEEALSTLMETENVDPVARGQSKAFPCPECGKRFGSKSNLNHHLKVHNDDHHERPFECEQCGVAFRHRSSLASHQRTHLDKCKFVCHVCEKAFLRKEYLTEHVLIHSGEKPHKCNVCEKAFRQRSTLGTHRKIHLREEE